MQGTGCLACAACPPCALVELLVPCVQPRSTPRAGPCSPRSHPPRAISAYTYCAAPQRGPPAQPPRHPANITRRFVPWRRRTSHWVQRTGTSTTTPALARRLDWSRPRGASAPSRPAQPPPCWRPYERASEPSARHYQPTHSFARPRPRAPGTHCACLTAAAGIVCVCDCNRTAGIGCEDGARRAGVECAVPRAPIAGAALSCALAGAAALR
ncbi:hypothetical protein BC834DRAFT_460924 [Gloeopeniophorella convolvens]|nr:hypothetical protein BC834DRAFT_460924 [Gloeopeniophorella convolvens]